MKVKKAKYIKEVLKYLKPLTKIPLKYRSEIVPLLSDECVHKICESCQNLLHNTYGLNEKKLSKAKTILFKSRKNIRVLAKPSSSLLSKRKLLKSNQTGKGIFSVLASIIVPALIGVLSK